MTEPLRDEQPVRTRHVRRAPSNSILYDRVLPIVFVLLAVVMFVLILFAVGVLIGIVPYQ